MLIRLIVWTIIISFIYQLLTKFILPAFRITSVANERMRQMQEQMKEMDRKIDEQNKKPKRRDGDYIDYEEVK